MNAMMNLEDIEKAVSELPRRNSTSFAHGLSHLTPSDSTRSWNGTPDPASWTGWRKKRSRSTARASPANYEAFCACWRLS
jgi:hypothetical protein